MQLELRSTYVFMKFTTYIARGVQTIGWSVRMALIACFTQYSGFRGGKKGAISFLHKHEQNITTNCQNLADDLKMTENLYSITGHN